MNFFMVCTKCMTYNHEPYIKDSLNGFCLQHTTFPVIYCIIDDASEDGTPDVIRNYLYENFDFEYEESFEQIADSGHIYFARHNINTNCFFSVTLLNENHYSISKDKSPYFSEYQARSKYIALCEGDDYWIDPQKLQKQVDFMEKHPDYSLCFTNYKKSNGTKRYQLVFDDDKYEKGLIENYSVIGTLSTLFRNSVYRRIPQNWVKYHFRMGDLPLWIELAHEGKVKYLKDVTAVYRVLSESASHSKDINSLIDFYDNGYRVRMLYNKLYGGKYHFNYPYNNLLKCAYNLNDKKTAHRMMKEIIKNHQLSLRSVVLYLGVIIPGLKKVLNYFYYRKRL